jgi:predicted Zn-dependent protease
MKEILIYIGAILFSTVVLGQKKNTNHDLSCYDNGTLIGSEFENSVLESIPVSISEELEVGKAVYDQMASEYTIRTSGSAYERVNRIMKLLVAQIAKYNNPAKNPNFGKYTTYYKIYVIESDEINAFTAGARIFITTGIYNFCQNDSELAAIIGHEISHNELGHIGKHVKRQKGASSFFGSSLGDLAYFAGRLVTMPFGQTDEGHCDLFGMDLAKSAGFLPCSTVDLWERMAENSGEKSFLNLFSSHPYSGDRATCAKSHLKENHSLQCD